MRIKHKVTVRIAEDTLMKNLLFGPDDVLSEITVDDYVRQVSGLIAITAAGSEDLPLGDVTAVKGLYLRTDSDCVLKLNGGIETIQMRVPTNGTYAKLFIEADITGVNITADAGGDLSGMFCAWGDTV